MTATTQIHPFMLITCHLPLLQFVFNNHYSTFHFISYIPLIASERKPRSPYICLSFLLSLRPRPRHIFFAITCSSSFMSSIPKEKKCFSTLTLFILCLIKQYFLPCVLLRRRIASILLCFAFSTDSMSIAFLSTQRSWRFVLGQVSQMLFGLFFWLFFLLLLYVCWLWDYPKSKKKFVDWSFTCRWLLCVESWTRWVEWPSQKLKQLAILTENKSNSYKNQM